jgi:hypothetical protein
MDMEVMVAMVAMVVGVTHPMAGVILITDMDTIIPHLITPILKVDVVASMVTVSPGQDIRDMEPGT